MSNIIQRTREIIFSNEGTYSSVNQNDNGALSIGICQWHGNRAKTLLKLILSQRNIRPDMYLNDDLYIEIASTKSWSNRVLSTIEKSAIATLINTPSGRLMQDATATLDISNYIKHAQDLGFKNENILIFLADIENQGGQGASTRIGRTALTLYGMNVTLEQMVKTAINDKVFSEYRSRRFNVYEKLTGKKYTDESTKTIDYYTVKRRDTLTLIAKLYNTTVERLMKDNNIENKNLLITGQRLRIEKEG